MKQQHFALTMLTDKSATEVYDAINNVYGWWSQDFKGSSATVGNVFEVRFADIHYSQHQVTEQVPAEKIAWLVTDSSLNFLKDKTEWNGTTNVFEINSAGDKTQIVFTHQGLVPQIECFVACSGGWTHFLQNSLLPFINTGVGNPQKATGVLYTEE